MRILLATTCLTPVALLAAAPAAAQTTVSTATTTPLKTSTSGDITITAAGSITTTSGTVVTVDSNKKASNAGTIQVTNADNSTGIGAVAGGSGTIENTGKINFSDTPGGATRIDVMISYRAPMGVIGERLSRLLTPVFSNMVEKDILNFKHFMENTTIVGG